MVDGKTHERLNDLADMLHDVVEHATRLQNSAESATTRLQNASSSVDYAVRSLPQTVSAAVEGKLTSAANAAATQMTANWAAANDAARQAKEAYQSAESQITWKLIGVGCAVLATIIFSIVGLLIYVTPAVQELRDERDGLLLHIKKLRDQGADIQMSVCLDGARKRPCVRIDPNAPEFNNGYRILAGH